MSGGSYNYLCFADDLSSRKHDITEMAERLERTGYYGPARATRDVLRLLEGAERAAAALRDVWHAVEWVDSCDWGEDSVRERAGRFQPWPPPAPGEDDDDG